MDIKGGVTMIALSGLLLASMPVAAQHKNCYAKAMPDKGNVGGHHWALNLQLARNGAIDACRKHNNYPVSDNSKTCKVVEQRCNKEKK